MTLGKGSHVELESKSYKYKTNGDLSIYRAAWSRFLSPGQISTQETNKLCATFKSSPPSFSPCTFPLQLHVCRDTANLCAEFSNAQRYEQLSYHLKRKLTHGQLVLVLCLRCVIASWNHPHKFSHASPLLSLLAKTVCTLISFTPHSNTMRSVIMISLYKQAHQNFN